MKEQLTLKDLCGYLPFKLKVLDTVIKKQKVMNLGQGTSSHWVGIKTILNYQNAGKHIYKPIFRNLATDLTREIIDEIGFVDIPRFVERKQIQNLPNWVCTELMKRHFWLGDQSYFEKGIILDYNDATTALNPKTEKCKCDFPLVRNDGKEYCGTCNENI